MTDETSDSVGWCSVVFSVAESTVDIKEEEWKSKHKVEKLSFEIELEQPTVLGGIKIGAYSFSQRYIILPNEIVS